jgi:CheY-like chemotaxis protein
MNRIMLDKLLRMEGAQTTLTENGQTALDVLRSDLSGFDVVLMDIQMPYLDGLSATREIRSDSRLASVPIVAVSAGVLDEERGAAFEAGVDHFIAKPIRLDTLVGILKPYIH